MKVQNHSRDKFPLMSDINMVPFIDVTLVLLIIFMVVTPILVSSQIKINVPQSQTGVTQEAAPVKVQVSSQGLYYIDGQSILVDDISAQLKFRLSSTPNLSVLIEADSAVSFDKVVHVMDQIKLAGVQKMGVSVTNENPSR